MKFISVFFSCILLCCSTLFADTHYVDVNNTNPVYPYTNWTTAATRIQDAVDAAADGAIVIVGDGHYLLSSEITVTNEIIIQSFNGPTSTIVDGQASVRCFNLWDSACTLSSLTVTNGYDIYGGGIFCSGLNPMITNCVITGNSAMWGAGGMLGGTAYNCKISGNSVERGHGGGMGASEAISCTISGNSAGWGGGGLFDSIATDCTISDNWAAHGGGGMDHGTANNCTLSGNSAGYGGGMTGGTANNCIISDNSAAHGGGGMNHGTANNCTISGNSAGGRGGGIYGTVATNCIISGNSAVDRGGGMAHGMVNNCMISGNSAGGRGGGMAHGTANNCMISGNSAGDEGGGMDDGMANNCTISGNTSDDDGGGVAQGKVNNCIIWYNSAPTNLNIVSSMTYVDFTSSPDVEHGVDGNITNAPLFVDPENDDYRLLATSPCIDAGSNAYVTDTADLIGNPRIIDGDLDGTATVDMGAYEFQVVTIPADCIRMPTINTKSKGRTPVTIRSTAEFDASLIDPASVRCADAVCVHQIMKDVDDDGIKDLKLHFPTSDMIIDVADGKVLLLGQTYDGTYVVGVSEVKMK